MADAHANFAASVVATAPSPAVSGLSLVVTAAEGALFPAVPFNATLRPAATAPTSTNAEIVRVTARTTDTLTIARAQEGTTAKTVLVGWVIEATITKKTLTDIEQPSEVDLVTDWTTITPTTPATGAVLFARSRSGRRMLAQLGPSGVDYPFQPSLAVNSVAAWRPTGNGLTITVLGAATPTAIGTATAALWANTSFLASLKRISYISGVTAGVSGGAKFPGFLQNYRGDAAGRGGFHLVVRFGFAAIPATRRWFVGMLGSTASPANADPSTLLNTIGVGQDVADTLVQFMHNDGAGVATKTSSALASPAVNEVWEVRVFCAPNSATIGISVEKLNAGVAPVDYTYASTNIPALTQGLLPILWANNGTTAAAIDLQMVGVYLEADY